MFDSEVKCGCEGLHQCPYHEGVADGIERERQRLTRLAYAAETAMAPLPLSASAFENLANVVIEEHPTTYDTKHEDGKVRFTTTRHYRCKDARDD